MNKRNKTSFVTVLSWILIILSGIGLLMSIIQNVIINLMFDSISLNEANQTSNGFTGFIFSKLNILAFVLGLLMLLSFISAIGLLKRKNWARIVCITLFIMGIVYMISFVVLQWRFMDSILEQAPKDEFGEIFYFAHIFFSVIVLGLCILFGWLIRKLTSSRIKAEF